jgi:hypothetical protein
MKRGVWAYTSSLKMNLGGHRVEPCLEWHKCIFIWCNLHIFESWYTLQIYFVNCWTWRTCGSVLALSENRWNKTLFMLLYNSMTVKKADTDNFLLIGKLMSCISICGTYQRLERLSATKNKGSSPHPNIKTIASPMHITSCLDRLWKQRVYHISACRPVTTSNYRQLFHLLDVIH